MINKIRRTKKNSNVLASVPKETKRIISDVDIRNRAFEIYQEDKNSSSSELENWFYAERELNGYYK